MRVAEVVARDWREAAHELLRAGPNDVKISRVEDVIEAIHRDPASTVPLAPDDSSLLLSLLMLLGRPISLRRGEGVFFNRQGINLSPISGMRLAVNVDWLGAYRYLRPKERKVVSDMVAGSVDNISRTMRQGFAVRGGLNDESIKQVVNYINEFEIVSPGAGRALASALRDYVGKRYAWLNGPDGIRHVNSAETDESRRARLHAFTQDMETIVQLMTDIGRLRLGPTR